MATRLRTDSNLNVAYADTDADSHVSIDGTAALSTDRAKLAQLWSPGQSMVYRRRGRSGPVASGGENHSCRILEREGQQGHPAVQDGQGGVSGEPPSGIHEHKELRVS